MTKKIGLYNLEPKYVNTALMQISTYHKNRGDVVAFYNPLFEYDLVYVSSIFDYSPRSYVRPHFIKGGTGFDLTTKLPKEIEKSDYDWSLYPQCDHSILWFSRGCVRSCPFCVVPEKEGLIQPVDHKNLNPNGKYIKINDNNFFANPMWEEAIDKIISFNQKVSFQCGIDVRTLNKEKITALKKVRFHGQLYIAWDNPRENLTPQIKNLIKQIKAWRIMCYVLVGYWSSEREDLTRIQKLRKLGVDPYVMPYDRKSQYTKRLARWCNNKAICESVEWKDYKYRVKK